jgi:hypothetical protein
VQFVGVFLGVGQNGCEPIPGVFDGLAERVRDVFAAEFRHEHVPQTVEGFLSGFFDDGGVGLGISKVNSWGRAVWQVASSPVRVARSRHRRLGVMEQLLCRKENGCIAGLSGVFHCGADWQAGSALRCDRPVVSDGWVVEAFCQGLGIWK